MKLSPREYIVCASLARSEQPFLNGSDYGQYDVYLIDRDELDPRYSNPDTTLDDLIHTHKTAHWVAEGYVDDLGSGGTEAISAVRNTLKYSTDPHCPQAIIVRFYD